jgi:hypothetical protein
LFKVSAGRVTVGHSTHRLAFHPRHTDRHLAQVCASSTAVAAITLENFGRIIPKPERRRALGRVIDVDQAKVDRRPVVAADAGGLRALPDQEAASIATAHVGHFGAASFFVVQSAEKGRSRLGTSRSRTTGYEQAAVISPSSPSTAACSHTGRLLGIGGMICSSRRSISTPSAPSWPTPGWTAASQARKRTLAATRL